MLLSLSRVRWWGEKSPAEEKITAVNYWRNCFYISIPGGDYQLTILEQILIIGYSWCDCAAFLTVLSLCVSPKNSALTDGFLQVFKEHVGNRHCSGQDHQGSALVPWQDKMLGLVPSSLVYNDTWVLCIICGQLDEFGQQFWWSLELGCHGQCSRPFLADSFHLCNLSLCSVVAFYVGAKIRAWGICCVSKLSICPRRVIWDCWCHTTCGFINISAFVG